MVGGAGAGAAAQDELVERKFAGIFAESSGPGLKAGVGKVGAGGPLPDLAEEVIRTLGTIRRGVGREWAGVEALCFGEISFDGAVFGGHLPLGFCGESVAGPAGEGVGLEIADMAEGLVGIDGAEAAKSHQPPLILAALPIQGGAPAFVLEPLPAQIEP